MNTSTKRIKKSLLKKMMLQVFPMLQQERTQSFIIISLTLIAVIIFGLFAINPTVATILQLRKQLADNTLVYAALHEKVNNLSMLQQKYAQLEPDLPLVLAAVPASHTIPELVGQIQGLAAKNTVTIMALQTDPLVLDPTGKQYTFSLTIAGDRERILSFITDTLSFERIITLQEIRITSSPAEKGTITQALIKARAYFKTL